MTNKKTTKAEKKTESKKPVELQDVELGAARGARADNLNDDLRDVLDKYVTPPAR